MNTIGILILLAIIVIELWAIGNKDDKFLAERDPPESDIEARVKRNEWLKKNAINAAMKGAK